MYVTGGLPILPAVLSLLPVGVLIFPRKHYAANDAVGPSGSVLAARRRGRVRRRPKLEGKEVLCLR
jgi:hypothetical protein